MKPLDLQPPFPRPMYLRERLEDWRTGYANSPLLGLEVGKAVKDVLDPDVAPGADSALIDKRVRDALLVIFSQLVVVWSAAVGDLFLYADTPERLNLIQIHTLRPMRAHPSVVLGLHQTLHELVLPAAVGGSHATGQRGWGDEEVPELDAMRLCLYETRLDGLISSMDNLFSEGPPLTSSNWEKHVRGGLQALLTVLSLWLYCRDREKGNGARRFEEILVSRVPSMMQASVRALTWVPGSHYAYFGSALSLLHFTPAGGGHGVSSMPDLLKNLTDCIKQEGIAVIRTEEALYDPWLTHLLYCFLRRKHYFYKPGHVEDYALLRDWYLHADASGGVRGPLGAHMGHLVGHQVTAFGRAQPRR